MNIFDTFTYMLTGVDQKNYFKIDFDNVIAGAYDKIPFKTVIVPDNCDMVAGEFFLQRSAAQFVASSVGNQPHLIFAYKVTDYPMGFKYTNILVYTIMGLTLFALVYTLVVKKGRKEQIAPEKIN